MLTDYLRNLHSKYQAETPNIKVSLSTFARLRPKNILLSAFISRNSCQCIHHQNMALKVQSLRKAGIQISAKPEKFLIRRQELDELLKEIPEREVYKVWTKVEIEGSKWKMMVVEVEEGKDKFIEDLKSQTDQFFYHCERVREQCQQVKTLKEFLPEHEMMVQKDFAENFSCRSLDEVQTAHWNQTTVTIH